VVELRKEKTVNSFVKEFNRHVVWKVEAARNGQVVEQGVCYISSNENSVKIEENEQGEVCLYLDKSKDDPLDILFSSMAETFHQNSIGVLLSGTGNDGSKGFARINEESGITIAQQTNCCVYSNLTRHAIDQGVVNVQMDEGELADGIEYMIA